MVITFFWNYLEKIIQAVPMVDQLPVMGYLRGYHHLYIHSAECKTGFNCPDTPRDRDGEMWVGPHSESRTCKQ